jgi:hypothetical protein
MNRRLALTAGLGALLSARVVIAQEINIGYQGLPHKASGESQTGINLGEGLLLHVGAGSEIGYDSNVYYGNSTTGMVSSGLVRATSFVELTNASRTGATSAGLSFDVRGGLTYRRYLADNPDLVPFRDALMPVAGVSLGYGLGRFSFQLTDSFLRLEDPPYGRSSNSALTRDSNVASVEGRYSPGGGRITTMLRYANTIDLFESASFSYGSSLTHMLTLDVSWKWLPKTALFFQANQGWVTYLSSNTKGKFDSYPLRMVVGLRGLITAKLTANVSLGYTNAFYSGGQSTSGLFGSTYFDAQVTYHPTMVSRAVAGLHHDFVNSVISAFYYDYSVYASYVHQIAGRLAFDLSARLTHKDYQGLLFVNPDATAGDSPSRVDNGVTVGASLDYFVRNWVYAGVAYSLGANISDATVAHIPVDYVKHQVFARLGLTY